MIKQGQEFYLTESLQQPPSACIIFDKDLSIKWMNNSSKYIFCQFAMDSGFYRLCRAGPLQAKHNAGPNGCAT